MLSHSILSNSLQHHGLQYARLLCPWDSPGKNTGVGCHFFLQGIFQTQGLNPHFLRLLHWQVNEQLRIHTHTYTHTHTHTHTRTLKIWRKFTLCTLANLEIYLLSPKNASSAITDKHNTKPFTSSQLLETGLSVMADEAFFGLKRQISKLAKVNRVNFLHIFSVLVCVCVCVCVYV